MRTFVSKNLDLAHLERENGNGYRGVPMSNNVKRILVVDDEDEVVTYIKMLLSRRTTHLIETTTDPRAALARVQEEQFNLVLSDVEMPGLRGTDLTREILAISPTTRVVLMSGDEPESVAAQTGAFFLKKPITTTVLLDVVERALSTSSGEVAGPAGCRPSRE